MFHYFIFIRVKETGGSEMQPVSRLYYFHRVELLFPSGGTVVPVAEPVFPVSETQYMPGSLKEPEVFLKNL